MFQFQNCFLLSECMVQLLFSFFSLCVTTVSCELQSLPFTNQEGHIILKSNKWQSTRKILCLKIFASVKGIFCDVGGGAYLLSAQNTLSLSSKLLFVQTECQMCQKSERRIFLSLLKTAGSFKDKTFILSNYVFQGSPVINIGKT